MGKPAAADRSAPTNPRTRPLDGAAGAYSVSQQWKVGDKIRHAGRPEWGVGSVLAVEGTVQNGVKCQRVDARFDRAGLKTLSTAFADLRSADSFFPPPPTMTPDSDTMDPLGSSAADKTALTEALAAVPEPARDPFSSLKKRAAATLDLYRFNGRGGSLLDWATMQTGLKDPLSVFSRHELEQLFQRFSANLEAHLRKLWRDFRKQDPAGAAEVSAAASPAIKPLVQRLNAER